MSFYIFAFLYHILDYNCVLSCKIIHAPVGIPIKKSFALKEKFFRASLLINWYCSKVDCDCEMTFIVIPFDLLAMTHLQVVNKSVVWQIFNL